jgi:hypothetical protein
LFTQLNLQRLDAFIVRCSLAPEKSVHPDRLGLAFDNRHLNELLIEFVFDSFVSCLADQDRLFIGFGQVLQACREIDFVANRRVINPLFRAQQAHKSWATVQANPALEVCVQGEAAFRMPVFV